MCGTARVKFGSMWRKRGARASALAALAVLVATLGSARDARACTVTAPGWYGGLVTNEVPTDGIVIVTYSCSSECAAFDSPPIVVRDAATGAEVPGATSPLPDVPEASHAYGFRPTEPLALGSYEVDLGNVRMLSGSAFQVVPPVAVDFDLLGFMRTLDAFERDEGEKTCCPIDPDTCGKSQFCYTEEFQRLLSAGVEWKSYAVPSGLGQYLARATWNDRGPEDWAPRYSSSATFEVAADEYCYVLEFKSLADGTVTTLDAQCMAHPSSVTLGHYEKDPSDLRSSLGYCNEPPDGLEDAWCEARAERCAPLSPTHCTNLVALCPGLFEDGGVSDGGTPDAGGGGIGGTGPGAPDAGPDDETRTIRTNAGCLCAATGAHGSSPLWPAALAVLVVAYRRRARSV